MYNLIQFGHMIADKVRMQVYTRALEKAVKPGSVVVDIGTGTGIFAFLACQFGARQVYAIESNELIRVAEQIANQNNIDSKIEFIKAVSTNTRLAKKVDIVISDLRGVLPLFGQHINSIMDARKRFLKPAGVLIPAQDVLWVSLVEVPDLYKEVVYPWRKYNTTIKMSIARNMAVNQWIRARGKSNQLLTHPAKWATLDYLTIQSPNIAGHITQKAKRSGVAHGLLIWFDAELYKGIWFHNTPGIKMHPDVYGSAFFPFQNPVKVINGDKIDVELKATLVEDEYVWNWDTHITRNNGREIAHFKQSTFYSQRLSLSDLRKNDLAYIPTMNIEGEIDKFIINAMNGSDTIAKVAQKVIAKFPGKFKDIHDASARISKLAKKYSE